MATEHTGNKETCIECFSIWEWQDTCCPECGSELIEDYHSIECQCEECKQGFREDPNIDELYESGMLQAISDLD